jgi:hypothetical protein
MALLFAPTRSRLGRVGFLYFNLRTGSHRLTVERLSQMDTRPPYPKQYSAEIVRSDGERYTVYADGARGRQETHFPDGRTKILISRPDKGVGWTLSPETNTYSQFKFTQSMVKSADRFMDSLYDWRADGTEVIDGRQCLRFIGNYRPKLGPCGGAHELHYIDAKTKMPRREVTFNLKGKKALTVDTLNVVLRRPAPKTFEIPPGYKRGYRKKT